MPRTAWSRKIRSAGGEAVANKASVADRDGAKSIVDDAVRAFGTVDIVVNNAGILRDKSFKKMTLDEWDLVLDVHLNGTAYVTWHAWPIMYDKNYGRVVFTSSVSGIFGSFGQANYGAAKMGMVGLMNNLAREGASHNVRTNCLSPGAATRMTASVPGSTIDPDNPDPGNHPGLVSPAVLHLAGEDAPNGRIIQAMRGRFSSNMMYSNKGVDLGTDASINDARAAHRRRARYVRGDSREQFPEQQRLRRAGGGRRLCWHEILCLCTVFMCPSSYSTGATTTVIASSLTDRRTRSSATSAGRRPQVCPLARVHRPRRSTRPRRCATGALG